MKTINSNLMGMTLGIDTVMHGEMKLIISKGEIKVSGAYKYVIAGTFISDQNIKEIDGVWHSMEGTGILIPSRLHSDIDRDWMEGGRLGQMLTAGFHINPDQWKKHKEFNK